MLTLIVLQIVVLIEHISLLQCIRQQVSVQKMI